MLTLDLHASQIEGFFRIPVDNLTAGPILVDAVGSHISDRAVVVAPDTGRVRMATQYAERLRFPLVVLHKRRESGSKTAVTHVVGEVQNCSCILIDDMIATAGTIATSVEVLLKQAPVWISVSLPRMGSFWMVPASFLSGRGFVKSLSQIP